MANIAGSFTFGDSYQISAQSPFDVRTLVETEEDLIATNSWNIKTHRPYKGMIVSVASTGNIYVLLDESKVHSWEGWKKQSGSGSNTTMFLTQDEYDNLTEIDNNTIYYIYEDGD